jgi:gamma-glutamyltranspeptidase
MQSGFERHRPLVMGTSWMITADHPLAAQAGAMVLEAGGNAVDAAIAANLVLCVARPHMCGLGGDLFALIYQAQSGELHALNGSGRAPQKASLEAYADLGLESIPETGPFTNTVPGAVHAWEDALKHFGSMTLGELMPRAIHYAENGFPMYGELVEAIRSRRDKLENSPGCVRTFLPGGGLPQAGRLFKQPALARSLAAIAEGGSQALYQGELGSSLLEHVRSLGGLMSREDLAGHTGNWESPLKLDYKGLSLCTVPPNSQGIALLMQAAMLENLDLAAMGQGSPQLVHHMVEAKKLAFADRNRYVCDPAFHAAPIKRMLDKESAKKQAGRIDAGRAADQVAPRSFTTGGEDTVYLAVVDKQGNAVSLIQSLYEFFGSCVMDPETGIILHNRGRGFSLDPQHPNRLEPGKRPYHTLHPVMALKEGRPHLVMGTPGADGQTQTNMQVLVNLLEFGADPQEAVEAPRWRGNPDGGLLMESRFRPDTVQGLRDRGHRIELLGPYDGVMGSAQVIRMDEDSGVLEAGACPRRQAYAIGG